MNIKNPDLYYENLNAVYEAFGKEPATVSLEPVAKWLGINRRTIISKRDFPLKKLGNKYFIMKTALASWMTKSD